MFAHHMEIYLIRHTTPNIAKGICYGQTDIPLISDCEKEMVEVLTKIPTDFEAVFSSPLTRCTRLAEKIRPDFLVDARLMEIHFGEWEMKKWEDIPMEVLQPWMDNYITKAPPGGESMEEAAIRVQSFLDWIKKIRYNRILAVTHGGVIKLMNGLVKGTDKKTWMDWQVGYGEVQKIEV